MTEFFTFHDRALDETIKASAARFQHFQRILDETTSDMRNLEQWLRQCNICITVFVDVNPNDSYSTKLGWDREGDVWRLMVLEPTYDSNYGFEGYEARPALETSAKMRAACKPALCRLVEDLGRCLPEVAEQASFDLVLPPQGLKKRTNLFKKRKAEDIPSLLEPLEPPVVEPRLHEPTAEELDMLFANNDEIPF